MKRSIIVAALIAALATIVLGGTAAAAPSPKSESTITFDLATGEHGCAVTIHSSKDISNFTVNGVKTELSDGTTVLTLVVSPGDVITVKAGTTVATFTVPADAVCDDHGGDDHTGDVH
jgi:ABC-type glycerol-3-phosphate transport system substrate-binding protein